MRILEFGTHLDQSDPVNSARELESDGFDYTNCGEHLVFHGPTNSSFITLAAAAVATTTIKLLSAIVLLPLYPTILVAKLATSLDILSGGRYNLGVGVGGEYAKEYEVSGVPVRQRGSRADEALEVLHRFWREQGPITFKGRYHEFAAVRFEPKPLQTPRIPIWVAGRKKPAMVRAGRFGDVWFPYLYTPEMMADSLRLAREAAVEAGRNASEVEGAVLAYICLYDDAVKARRVASEQVGGVYKQDFNPFVDRYVIYGDAATVRSRMREFYDAGARKVMTFLAAPPDDRRTMRRHFVTEVMPEFQAVRGSG